MAVSKKVVCGCGETCSINQYQSNVHHRIEHTSIDGAERETEKPIAIGILLKLSADLLSKLNGLSSDSDPTDVHIICIDIAAGGASVSVGDVPGGALELLCSARLRWVIQGLTRDLGRRSFR